MRRVGISEISIFVILTVVSFVSFRGISRRTRPLPQHDEIGNCCGVSQKLAGTSFATHVNDTPIEDDLVWTFAFGANIGSGKLSRLGISPVEIIPGVLPGFTLSMDAVVPGVSETFATVSQQRGHQTQCVPGVLHKITPREFDILALSEPSYSTMRVNIWSLKSFAQVGEVIPAIIFLGNQRNSRDSSSVRYHKLIVCGAVEHLGDVCPSYLSTLRSRFVLDHSSPSKDDCSHARESVKFVGNMKDVLPTDIHNTVRDGFFIGLQSDSNIRNDSQVSIPVSSSYRRLATFVKTR